MKDEVASGVGDKMPIMTWMEPRNLVFRAKRVRNKMRYVPQCYLRKLMTH